MIPSLSEPSWTSVSDRIIPSDSTPRSFALPSRVPSGSTAPGSATITAWPAATFGAPQTIVRSSDPLRRTRAHAQAVGVGMRRDVQHVADAEQAAVAVHARARRRSRPARPRCRSARASCASSSVSCPGSQYSFSQETGTLHQNCSRKRRSFSNSRRRSGTPCFSIAMRSMPRPNAKPCTCSGS